MLQSIGSNDINEIAIGATLLGTGGGGDPYIGSLLAKKAIAENGDIQVLQIEDVPENEWVVPVAFFGAPLIIAEKLCNGNEAAQVFDEMEKQLGRKIFATMPIEAGGLNSMAPLALGAVKKIPIVDADGMGRAFPSLQMVIPTLHNISAGPIIQTDERGNVNIYRPITNAWGEIFVGSSTLSMGGSCVIACYPMLGKQLRTAVIPHVLSYCKKIGQAVSNAKQNNENPIAQLLKACNGRTLLVGKITDVSRKMDGRHQLGIVRMEGMGEDKNRQGEVFFRNEFLIAKVNDVAQVTTPDLIALVDIETAQPITTDLVKYGQRVALVVMPCHSQWRTNSGLALAGPRVFDFDFDYIPFFN